MQANTDKAVSLHVTWVLVHRSMTLTTVLTAQDSFALVWLGYTGSPKCHGSGLH